MGTILLPHLVTAWHVDQAILSEENRLVVIRFGDPNNNPDLDIMDEVLSKVAPLVQKWAVIYVCDISKVPDFNHMYELNSSEEPFAVMFFFRNKHIMCDFGTGNNNKMNFVERNRQDVVNILEAVYRGATKGKGQVNSPKDYSTRHRY